jgi:hypothetical protein
LGSRLPGAIRQLPPDQAAQFGRAGTTNISINEPAKILALPAPIRGAIQSAFVESLHTVFLVAGIVAVVAVAITIALPDQELRGGEPGYEGTAEGASVDEQAAAVI